MMDALPKFGVLTSFDYNPYGSSAGSVEVHGIFADPAEALEHAIKDAVASRSTTNDRMRSLWAFDARRIGWDTTKHGFKTTILGTYWEFSWQPLRPCAAAALRPSDPAGGEGKFDAAQYAFDQQSDDPAPGDWNAACVHISDGIRRLSSTPAKERPDEQRS